MIDRGTYAAVYGPALGDRVRLGDTDLWVEVTGDRTAYGDEAVAGFGRSIRDGLAARAASEGSCDLVVTNCLLLDPVLGIVKASIGIRDGRIAAVGRAGNPDLQDGIDVVAGTGTAIVSAEGLIATPGAVDSHVHLLSPGICDAALAAGVTTLVAQDFGPVWNLGANPPYALERMLAALDAWPLNVALLCRASASRPETVEEALLAGARD
jgi:urease subunit alpha